MDNAAIAVARGEFILWCDSDDYLHANAIERLIDTWESIPVESRGAYVGVTALCATEEGTIVNPFPGTRVVDVSWNDLLEVHRVSADMLFFTRAAALKRHPFPEVDLVIPESVVWSALGNQPTRLLPEVLKIVEYRSAHCISFSGRMAYNRGRAYALASTVKNTAGYRRGARFRWWRLITFLRYCRHGEIRLDEASRLWRGNSSQAAFWAAVPIASLIALRDTVLGKVDKTHREFVAARDHVSITVEWLGSP
jgi:glycosyltransferase involved in cell wall biosynthesis